MKLTTKKSHFIARVALAAICMVVPALVQAQELRGKITDLIKAKYPDATVTVVFFSSGWDTRLDLEGLGSPDLDGLEEVNEEVDDYISEVFETLGLTN